MNINEVEKLLNISRANVRFYEKEGLITPQRHSNGYRDYSDEDIEKLKQIIILRKIGISIPNIKRIFEKDIKLNDAVGANIFELKKQISELNGALLISKEIAEKGIELDSLDTDLFYKKINFEEENGNRFNDILNDYLSFEKSIFIRMWKNVFLFNFSRLERKNGITASIIIILLICIIRGLMCQFVWHSKSFFEGFVYPFEIFAIASIILLPLYLFAKKHK